MEVGNGGGLTQEVRESAANDAVGSFFDLFTGSDDQSVLLNPDFLNWEWNLSSELHQRKWAWVTCGRGHIVGRNRFAM